MSVKNPPLCSLPNEKSVGKNTDDSRGDANADDGKDNVDLCVVPEKNPINQVLTSQMTHIVVIEANNDEIFFRLWVVCAKRPTWTPSALIIVMFLLSQAVFCVYIS